MLCTNVDSVIGYSAADFEQEKISISHYYYYYYYYYKGCTNPLQLHFVR